ncbi:hypothetical protein [Phaeocystidibacter luteus]|uniref:Uncharacterized protein n=1 Tax=Phaeocystidibacter luteus TaxID=911197 RepID=A0A6N6RF51_9FLAO|nr:hypothetical protein [Phaeocystidibacter luteus]KAB2806784.1 hypothetical protein F8C67_13020 [Phaeocystidibacter luteus]
MHHQIRINTRKTPFLGRAILFLISLGCILGILAILISPLVFNERFHAGYLFLMAILAVLFRYMIRHFLWNTYGAEVLTLGENLTYQANYRYFKSKPEEFDSSTLYCHFIPVTEIKVSKPMLDQSDKMELGYLQFGDAEREWHTVLTQDELFMQDVIDQLDNKYGLNT